MKEKWIKNLKVAWPTFLAMAVAMTLTTCSHESRMEQPIPTFDYTPTIEYQVDHEEIERIVEEAIQQEPLEDNIVVGESDFSK